MAGQKAQRTPTITDRLKESLDNSDSHYALDRQMATPLQVGVADLGSSSASDGGVQSASGSFLKTAGDTMVGPIAFFPVDVIISGTDFIDISKGVSNPPDHSTYVIMTGAGATDDLELIKGAAFSGQWLILQGVLTQNIKIEDFSSNAGGNIATPDGNDFQLDSTSFVQVVQLIFDIVIGPNGNTGGWRLITSSTAATGFANTALSNLIATSINQALVPNANGTLDLGTALNSWDSLWARALRFDDDVAAPTGASPHKISTGTIGMHFNVDLAIDDFQFYHNGVAKMNVSSSTITHDNAIFQNTLTMNDNAGDPSSNGQLARNVNDLKVFTGGSVKDFTQMPEKDQTETITGLWTFTNVIHNINSANIFLGDAVTDDVSILAHVDTDLIPDADDTQDLGSLGLNWADLHISAVIVEDRIHSDSNSSEMGVFMKDEPSTALGTLGTLQGPLLEQAALPTDATLDGFFGAFDGAHGFWRDTDDDANSRGFVRMNAVWYFWFLSNLP